MVGERYVAVVGPSEATSHELERAEAVGRLPPHAVSSSSAAGSEA